MSQGPGSDQSEGQGISIFARHPLRRYDRGNLHTDQALRFSESIREHADPRARFTRFNLAGLFRCDEAHQVAGSIGVLVHLEAVIAVPAEQRRRRLIGPVGEAIDARGLLIESRAFFLEFEGAKVAIAAQGFSSYAARG